MSTIHRKLIITLMLSGLMISAQEKILRYPYGCYPVRYKFDYYNLVLQPAGQYHPQTVYFIHNISSQGVNLFQVSTGEDPYTIHINTTIAPHNWSVLSTGQKRLK